MFKLWKSKKEQVAIYAAILHKDIANMRYQVAYDLAYSRLRKCKPELEKHMVYRKLPNEFKLTSKKKARK